MNRRFGIVVGEFTDTSFNQLVSGSERRNSPRSDCRASYTIAQEPDQQDL